MGNRTEDKSASEVKIDDAPRPSSGGPVRKLHQMWTSTSLSTRRRDEIRRQLRSLMRSPGTEQPD